MFDIVVIILVDLTKIILPLIGLRIIFDNIRTFLFNK